jgi:hypothetical protein
MDIGKKYMNRVVIYSSVFIGCYSIYALIFLLSYFKVLSFTFSFIVNAYSLFDITIVLIVMLGMLY